MCVSEEIVHGEHLLTKLVVPKKWSGTSIKELTRMWMKEKKGSQDRYSLKK